MAFQNRIRTFDFALFSLGETGSAQNKQLALVGSDLMLRCFSFLRKVGQTLRAA